MRGRLIIFSLLFVIVLLSWGVQREKAATPDYSLTGNAILFAVEGTGVNNGRLIKVTASTTDGWLEGPLTASTGLSLNWPWHISLDSAGYLYIDDRDNGRIVRVGDIAGTGWKAFSGVGSNILVPPPVIFETTGGGSYASQAVVDSAGRIYIVGQTRSNGWVVRIDNMNGDGWTMFNATNTCSFIAPTGVMLDAQGHIYIVDGGATSTHRIIRIDDMSGASCITYGSQGNGVGLFNTPESLTMDAQGRIYIADESNNRIVRINDITGAGWVSFGSYGRGVGQFYQPEDIALDNLGRIYISDTGNSRMVRINSMAGDGWVEFVRKGCYGNCNTGNNISGPFLIDASKGIRVLGSGPTLTYQGVFPQVAVGGGYRTSITGVNIGKAAVDAQVSLLKAVPPPCGGVTPPVCGAPFSVTVGDVTDSSFTRNVPPMGTMRLDAGSSGSVSAGYATFKSTEELAGVALFQSLNGDTITSEAGVSFSPATEHFIVYVDNTNNARTGYAIANPVWVYDTSPSAPGLTFCGSNWTLTLRDKSGKTLETKSGGAAGAPPMPCGGQVAEFADQRFPSSVGPGFEGSIEFAAGNLTSVGAQKWQQTNARAVALRYDNASQDVFTTIPVIVPVPDANEVSQSVGSVKTTFPIIEPRTLYYPQIADGGSYRTNFVLANPTSAATTVTVVFFADNGTPLALPINGTAQTSLTVPLAAFSVTHILTDGSSQGIKTGWARVSQPAVAAWFSVGGSAIFQTVSDGRITSEAGVSSSALTSHFTTPVSSLGFTQSGLAICNPNNSPVNLTFQLHDSSGLVVASATTTLPALGHMAQFFTDLFGGFDQFEGTVEVTSSGGPVSGVALRYDNPGGTVFATNPVIPLP